MLLSQVITIRKRYMCVRARVCVDCMHRKLWHYVASPVVVCIANELYVCKLYGRKKKEKIKIIIYVKKKKANRIRLNITIIVYTVRARLSLCVLLSDRYHGNAYEIIMSYFTWGHWRVRCTACFRNVACLVQRSVRAYYIICIHFQGTPLQPIWTIQCHHVMRSRMQYFNLFPSPSENDSSIGINV